MSWNCHCKSSITFKQLHKHKQDIPLDIACVKSVNATMISFQFVVNWGIVEPPVHSHFGTLAYCHAYTQQVTQTDIKIWNVVFPSITETKKMEEVADNNCPN